MTIEETKATEASGAEAERGVPMHEPTERRLAESEKADGGAGPSTKTVPRIIRRSTTRFGWRHVHGIAVIRFLVAIWLVCLGAIYCSFGYWWGALLFVAAGLVGWLSYQMPRWKVALDAGRDDRPPR
jgi:hypothetical protein